MLLFAPGVEVTPEVTEADEPSGLTVDIRVPQAPQLPPDLTTPEFKNVTVTLPSGFSISPSAGDGLQACTARKRSVWNPGCRGPVPTGQCSGRCRRPRLSRPCAEGCVLGASGCDLQGRTRTQEEHVQYLLNLLGPGGRLGGT